MMNKVYQQAKCEDFIADPQTDGFYTDSDYASTPDKRKLPTECAADNRWVDMKTTAEDAPPWEDDPADQETPKAEDCGSDDFPPIGSGKMYYEDGNSYEEKSCSYIPECHYSYRDEKCVPDGSDD